MSEKSSHDEVLFEEALTRAPGERTAFLDQECKNDPLLRSRLAALLIAHDASESLLESPPLHARLLPEENPGAHVGRYRLLEKIGEGGCGTVYLAEQQEPVRRQVALKVIKLGMDTHDVIARFEAERQALALMDHPNIARVFDAGATATGRPYFVMELVSGTRITAYCDAHSLSTTARLELFAQVCHAIQHAHQKGIIHRDIKPSNILVSEHDGVAVPKVIDFGIAKATHGRLTDRTVLTAIAQFLGTPVYMSPEQAELKAVDIDTRSDIYSLGVLLYELIAGRPPFDPQTLLSVGLDEIRRHIREVEPPRPSTRLSTLSAAERAAIAQDRGTDPAKLSHALRGDLDWIVMRCLEKDRTRRYETASSLGMDIQRYLDDLPVTATPPSAAYRFKKLVWRHKIAVSAGGTIVLLLLAGSIVSTWLAVRATRAERLAEARMGSELAARQEAEKQRQLALERLQAADLSRKDAEVQRKLAEDHLRSETAAREESERQKSLADQERRRARLAEKAAQAEAEISKAVNAFLQDDLLRQADSRVQAGSGAAPVADLTVREALDRAAEKVEGRFGNHPLIESGIRAVIGSTYLALGEGNKASSQLERALSLRRSELGPDDLGTVDASHQLALAFRSQGRLEAAVALDAEALELARRRTGEDSSLTLSSMTRLAAAYLALGRIADTVPLSEQTLEISRRIYGPADLRTLIASNNLAVTYHKLRRFDEAVTLYRATIETAEKALGPNHLQTSSWLSNLAQTYLAQGEINSAMTTLHQVVDARKQRLGPEHPDTLDAMRALASAQRHGGQYGDARELLDEIIAVQSRILGPNHPDTLQSLNQLGGVYWLEKREQEATALFTRVADSQARTLGPEHPDTITTLCNVAAVYESQGKLEDAATLLRKSITARRRTLGQRHRETFLSTRNLGMIYLRQRKFAEAEDLLLATCYNDLVSADLTDLAGLARDDEVVNLTAALARLYDEWGDPARAGQWRARLIPLSRRGGMNFGIAKDTIDLSQGSRARETPSATNPRNTTNSFRDPNARSNASNTTAQSSTSSARSRTTPASSSTSRPWQTNTASPAGTVYTSPDTRHYGNSYPAIGSGMARTAGNVSGSSERAASRAAAPTSIAAPAVTSVTSANASASSSPGRTSALSSASPRSTASPGVAATTQTATP